VTADATSRAPGAETPVREVVEALDLILQDGPGRLPADGVADVEALRHRIDERLALGDGLTVVALAGGTGVGKSALVNRLVGTAVAAEGVRRPTTGRPLAVAAELDGPTHALLDWLAIDDRRAVPGALPSGLMLVDLPDHDSVVEDHRLTSARLAARVDALLVVVDPVKYARADLHDGPLAALSQHADVVTVVLNRCDELAPDDVRRCREDLVRHLAARGLPGVAPLTTSARTAEGVEAVRAHVVELAAARTAAARRLVDDGAQLGGRLAAALPRLGDADLEVSAMVEPLLEAADGYRVIADAEVVYRRDAGEALRSPLARIVRRPATALGDLVRGLGIVDHAPEGTARATSTSRIAAVLAREVQLAATTGAAHAALSRTIDRTAHEAAPALVDAVDGVGIRPARRRWWAPLRWLRGLAEATFTVGLVWLVLLGLGDWLRLPELPTPQVTEVLTLPTALLLGGLAVRVLLGALSRWSTAVGGRRHRQAVERRLRERLGAAVHDRIAAPFAAEVARYVGLEAAIATLRGRAR
jgi:hypothetical protein